MSYRVLNMDNVSKKFSLSARKISRIIAIQSFYAANIHEQSNNIELICNEIAKNFNLNEFYEDKALINKTLLPDRELLNLIIPRIQIQLNEIELIITKYLKPNWNIKKLDLMIGAILCIAVYEIKNIYAEPIKIIIDDYVSITSLFYDKKEVGFINSILDKIARELRSESFISEIEDI